MAASGSTASRIHCGKPGAAVASVGPCWDRQTGGHRTVSYTMLSVCTAQYAGSARCHRDHATMCPVPVSRNLVRQTHSISRFDTISACDRRTDRHTHDRSMYSASIPSRGKNIRHVPMVKRLRSASGKVTVSPVMHYTASPLDSNSMCLQIMVKLGEAEKACSQNDLVGGSADLTPQRNAPSRGQSLLSTIAWLTGCR